DFSDESGNPISVPFVGFSASSITYTIAAKNAFRFTLSGTGSVTKSGSVRITPSDGATPQALAIFGYKPGAVTVSEAGLSGAKGSRFRRYVEASGTVGRVGWVQSGVAIANTSTSQSISVDLELTKLDGTSSGIAKKTITLGPSQKTA